MKKYFCFSKLQTNKTLIYTWKFPFVSVYISCLLLTNNCQLVFSQPPSGINYQAIARDPSGNPLASAIVTVTFNIHRSAANGPVSMSELHNTTTNQFGLFNLVLGSANVTAFDTIDWWKSDYFLEVIVNGNNMGTTQFLSVPYAFHAKTADSITPPKGLLIWRRNQGKIYLNTITDSVGIGTLTPVGKLDVTVSSGSADALNVSHLGTGRAAAFWVNNPSNDSAALTVYSAGKREAVFGMSEGTGHGGVFAVNNPSSFGYGLVGTTNGTGKAVFGYQTGMGYGGAFWIDNPANDSAAVVGLTDGNGPAVWGLTGGAGSAGVFEITNASNSAAALVGKTSGSGYAILGINSGVWDAIFGSSTGTQGKAGNFQISNSSNFSDALYSSTVGSGNALYGLNTGTGKAGYFQISNPSNNADALFVTTSGTGNAAWINGKVRISDGTEGTGKVLTSNAAGVASWQTPATSAPGFSNMQVYSSTGTFTFIVPAGITRIMVEVWGGGGGGGQSSSNATGGGGGYGKEIFSVTPLTTYTVTVGASGVGGASPASGGTSSFGSLISASGGGAGGVSPGTGGGSTAAFNISGGSGNWGNDPDYLISGGAGANGGVGGTGDSAPYINGKAPGGGGGVFSGNGANGRVVIWW